MEIKFWGVRGSVATPLTPIQVERKVERALEAILKSGIPETATVPDLMRAVPKECRSTVGGNTSCVEVRIGDSRLVLDAGTGIRLLGQEACNGPLGRGEGEIAILLSHLHWDHIQGLPFFAPIYIRGNRIHIFGVGYDPEKRLAYQQSRPFFPVPFEDLPATIIGYELRPDEQQDALGFAVTPFEVPHPDTAHGFRIEFDGRVFVYFSDIELNKGDDDFMEAARGFVQGADLLVCDSQYSSGESFEKLDWGHSSAPMVIDLALAGEVDQLALFHHDPENDDALVFELYGIAEEYLRLVGAETELEMTVAVEGMTISL